MTTESSSYQKIYKIDVPNKISRILIIILVVFVLCLFLPWTQNIRSNGNVTTLRQEQRVQKVNSIIPGQIVRWYVKEGDKVKAGDTLVQLTEVKDDYLDPNLVLRTNEQLTAKQQTVEFYEGKTVAQKNQLMALQKGLQIKLNQLNNKLKQLDMKIESESATLVSAKNDYEIANKQFERQQDLFKQGLVSLTQLEQRNQALQSFQARLVTAQNNLNNTRQEVLNTQLEINGVQQDNLEKTNKIQSDVMSNMSQIATGQGDVSKLKNQYSTYQNRAKLYFVIAPQDGQIVQAKRSGIGEIIKDGETLVEIVPTQLDYAVEMFVAPLDIPLLTKGQKVRFIFDGFPAIVFSGWPQASYGTFGGKIEVIENSVSTNGKYRILVGPDKNEKPWPPQLRLGTGTQSIALLKDVPIWYELWRNINGFPPDFYDANASTSSDKKSKSK
jgi:multidrug efflux pump subunit AcrA (membrane-fusion protein)